MKGMFLKNEKGFSLAETMVAIGIMSLVMMGVSLYLVRIWPLQRFAMDSAQAQLKASQSITTIVALIRNMRQSDTGEYALQSFGVGEIIFFADQDRDGAVERVRIFRDGTSLKMGIIQPSGSPATYLISQESVSTIITDIRNGSDFYPTELFHYYDGGNQELSGTSSVSDVRMVSIDVYVDINPSSSPTPAHFESFASIRNLTAYDRLQ